MDKRKSKHGFVVGSSKSGKIPRFYTIWAMMKQRCFNKNHIHYKRYGGAGITVCDKWIKFVGFRDDMYKSYLEHCKEFGEKETSIDRIDGTGNYELSNCRWATRKEQANNTKRNHFLTNNTDKLTVSQWAEKLRIPAGRIYGRLKSGWTDEEIFNNKKIKTKEGKAKYIDFVYEYRDKLDYLKEKYKQIMRYRYGFFDGNIYTLEETGIYFGITRQRIEQIEKASLGIIAEKT